jgi:nucleoside-diphosphate-sugar epimerase
MTTAPTPSLSVLVLGGTAWLSGAVAAVAVARGHQVTCLARGESGTPPDALEWVRSDRTEPTAYARVTGRRHWDAVVDVTSEPDQARSALEALAQGAEHWIYVSSCSVYSDHSTPDAAEDAATLDPYTGSGPAGDEAYGEAKVACEIACRTAMGPDRVLVARAGLIVGYGDPSDRFGYWPGRVAQAEDGSAVLVPPLDAPIQVIDVRDLAAWLVHCAEERVSGTYNAVGDVHLFADVVQACADASGRQPRWAEASDAWLATHEVQPWMGADSLPLWLPRPAYAGFMTRRNEAARAAGLELRPLIDTVTDSLRWERQCGLSRPRQTGLGRGREDALIRRVSAGD